MSKNRSRNLRLWFCKGAAALCLVVNMNKRSGQDVVQFINHQNQNLLLLHVYLVHKLRCNVLIREI